MPLWAGVYALAFISTNMPGSRSASVTQAGTLQQQEGCRRGNGEIAPRQRLHSFPLRKPQKGITGESLSGQKTAMFLQATHALPPICFLNLFLHPLHWQGLLLLPGQCGRWACFSAHMQSTSFLLSRTISLLCLPHTFSARALTCARVTPAHHMRLMKRWDPFETGGIWTKGPGMWKARDHPPRSPSV